MINFDLRIFFPIIILVCFLLPLLLFMKSSRNNLEVILKTESQKRSGVFNKTRFGNNPYFEFVHNGININVKYSAGKQCFLEIKTKIPLHDNFSFKIYKVFFLNRLDKIKSINIGNIDFDKEFVIRSSDSSRIKAIINSDIQAKLLECKSGYPELRFNNGNFEILMSVAVGFSNDEKRIEAIIDLAVCLCDRITTVLK